jgi:hypothetical protein
MNYIEFKVKIFQNSLENTDDRDKKAALVE